MFRRDRSVLMKGARVEMLMEHPATVSPTVSILNESNVLIPASTRSLISGGLLAIIIAYSQFMKHNLVLPVRICVNIPAMLE